MFSFGYSFFLSGPIIGYTSLSYFYIFSIVFYMIHYFDTIAKHPFLVALQMHPYQCSSLQYPPRIDKPAPSLIHILEIHSLAEIYQHRFYRCSLTHHHDVIGFDVQVQDMMIMEIRERTRY